VHISVWARLVQRAQQAWQRRAFAAASQCICSAAVAGWLTCVLSCSSFVHTTLAAPCLGPASGVYCSAVDCSPKAGVHAVCTLAWTARTPVVLQFVPLTFWGTVTAGPLGQQCTTESMPLLLWRNCTSLCCTLAAPVAAPSVSSSRTGLIER
jgi:hypothetical protein